MAFFVVMPMLLWSLVVQLPSRTKAAMIEVFHPDGPLAVN